MNHQLGLALARQNTRRNFVLGCLRHILLHDWHVDQQGLGVSVTCTETTVSMAEGLTLGRFDRREADRAFTDEHWVDKDRALAENGLAMWWTLRVSILPLEHARRRHEPFNLRRRRHVPDQVVTIRLNWRHKVSQQTRTPRQVHHVLAAHNAKAAILHEVLQLLSVVLGNVDILLLLLLLVLLAFSLGHQLLLIAHKLLRSFVVLCADLLLV